MKDLDLFTTNAKKFRVLFDCHTFDTGWQGTTTYLSGVLNALPQAMAKYAPTLELDLYCSASDEGQVRKYIQVPFSFVEASPSFLRRNALDIPRALEVIRAHLVVSQYVRPFFSPCPTMSVIHDVLFLDFPESFPWAYRKSRDLLFGWSARNSTILSTVSDYSASRIEAHFGVPANKNSVIPNGLHPLFLESLRQRRDPGKPLRMISVSRLERRKRHEWGLEAQKALSEVGIETTFTIVGGGEGEYADTLRAKVLEAQLRGYEVNILSGLPFKKLVDLYSQADIFLFPSAAEGFGIPVIEASAAGVPGVVSNGGALAELSGSFIGNQIPSSDKAAFISAVVDIARDIDVYRERARRKRVDVFRKYTWMNAANAYAQIFRGLNVHD